MSHIPRYYILSHGFGMDVPKREQFGRDPRIALALVFKNILKSRNVSL